MKKQHLKYLRRAVSYAAYIKEENTMLEIIGRMKAPNLPVYQMIRDIVFDARFYLVVGDDLFWINYSTAVICRFIDSLTPDDWENEELRTGKKEDFLNTWLSGHILPLSIEEKKKIAASLQLTAGKSGKPIPFGDVDDEEFQTADGLLGHLDSDISDKTNITDNMGKSLPKAIADYDASARAVDPGSQDDGHQAEAEYLNKLDPTIVELAIKIGRHGSSAQEVTGKFQSASRSDITGVTIGDNLNSLLPSELVLLASKATENLFYQRYVQKRLQLFSSASRSLKAGKDKSGPIYICVDTSGSMEGKPEVTTKTLALAVAIVAQRDKRPICMINYSHTLSFFILTDLGRQRNKFLAFLSHSYSGGNDENKLFNFIFKRLPTIPQYKLFSEVFEGADLLIISDFEWGYLSNDNLELIETARDKGIKFYGLGIDINERQLDCIDNSNSDDYDLSGGLRFLKQCDYRYLYNNGLITEYFAPPAIL